MNTRTNSGAKVGMKLGRMWSGLVRREESVTRWMIGHGISRLAAASILWIVKLAVLVILLYAGFWIAAVVLAVILIAAVGVQRADDREQPKWLEKDPDDHRDELFYDPLTYNDDPDPRFDDPRHHE